MFQPNSKTTKSYKIALIPGDGIGQEVILAGMEVLWKLTQQIGTFDLDFKGFDWSSAHYKKFGRYLPNDALDVVRGFDAVLIGCVGDTDVPDHISLRGLRLALCQPLQQYANVRPTRILRGITSPLRNCERGDLDWVIVRENSEGGHAGHGGVSQIGEKWAVATEMSVFTREEVERIMRFAFETARGRKRKHLTVVTKSNAQRNGLVFWDEVAAEVGKEFEDVKVEKVLVDGRCFVPIALFYTQTSADILHSATVAPYSNIQPIVHLLLAAASVIAIIQIAQSLSGAVWDYYQTVHNSRAEIKSLYSAVKTLELVLIEIEGVVRSGHVEASLLKSPSSALQSCRRSLEELQGKLKLSGRCGRLDRLAWPFKKAAVDSYVEKLEKHKSGLTIELSLQNLSANPLHI
ncbi:hypothetical protein NHQ30_009612 [Ciborinia camelliae]|nr:hypothetical protein NHQ30_009612 [Ciborinia camelliae]